MSDERPGFSCLRCGYQATAADVESALAAGSAHALACPDGSSLDPMTEQPQRVTMNAGPTHPGAAPPLGWCAGCLTERVPPAVAVTLYRGTAVCSRHVAEAAAHSAWWR